MRIIRLLAFVSCVLFVSCKQPGFGVPDHVEVVKTPAHVQLPGTKTFIAVPGNYKLVKELDRYQKDENTYVQIIEIPDADFAVKKEEALQGVDKQIKSGNIVKEYYRKEFKHGTQDAVLFYAADARQDEDQIVLLFGGKHFTVMAVGRMPAKDTASRAEVLKSLLSVYYDPNAASDPLALANFTIDVSGTGFKYSGHLSQMYHYTLQGKGNPVDDPFADMIMIASLPAMSEEETDAYADDMLHRHQSGGMEVGPVQETDTLIDGHYARLLSFNAVFKGKPASVYQLVVSGEHTAVTFLGCVYDRREELMGQVRKIAGTLKLKD
ncbi:hypothetical protein MKQ70_07810 [Chitinophaga sedimenti]|uniref:hypothetical protein n=1 Tax=Chitinophaga sedimenti TaxID=2033606 RepID=UPI002002C25B|nr:hypothetical protein [Chitinophaga sedimenti]MCK7554915.1 hypothetical protein [Chitinophaga sedimenti]